MVLKRLKNYENVVCLGIGGGAIYYIAQIFHFLGAEIIGYDISKNERTKELENLGIHINYKNKTTFAKETDLIIYTNALSDNLINKVIKKNTKPLILEAGQFSKLLLNKIERNKLTNIEKSAIEKADFAPLYKYDLGNTKIIGVTGTDGKTTTSTMIYHMLRSLGYNPGLISTVSAKINNKDIDTGLHTTTPSAQELRKILQIMKDKKCTHIILETTSHALDTGRVAGLKFDVAVYTNITNEHLDYHKTWLNYAKTKAKLLLSLSTNGKVLLNKDDTKSYKFLSKKLKNYNIYSLSELKNINQDERGISFSYKDKKIYVPVHGLYNVSNAIAAIKTIQLLKLDYIKAAKSLKNFEGVEGRMNIIKRTPFKVIVDFAHTPNALEQTLISAQKLKKKNGKLICVFGCAGKRDSSKRTPMGLISKKYSDITILAPEDPRTESLKKINDDISRGWKSLNIPNRSLCRFDNGKENIYARKKAIAKALNLAKKDDVVIICGKGHEKSLCFGTKEFEWNDTIETKKLLRERV